MTTPSQTFAQPRAWRWLVALLLIATFALAACQPTSTPANGTNADPPPAEEETTAPDPTETPVPETAPAGEGAPDQPASSLEPAQRDGMYDAPPEMTIDPSKYYYATFKTEKGDIRAQLFAERAPVTVNNFVFLAREGFYDNTRFHRVLENFMAQAGDPTGTGAGGPGYRFQDEIVPGLEFDRGGLLAMANAGPGTNGSQFFITFAETPWLNGAHTIFGEVLDGREVLDELTRRDPQQAPDAPGDELLTVEIEEMDSSELPTPTPAPPTPTPTNTPTPFAPDSMAPDDLAESDRPLAALPMEERSNFYNSAPGIVIDQSKTYTARIVTSQGEIALDLFDDEAPVAVNNFVLLAALGFYDGTPVNDVSGGQVVIIGAPENVPTSFVGYRLDGERGLNLELSEGAVGYLPAPDPATGDLQSNGSQLLIALIAPPAESGLDISFFGTVTEGLDVLGALTAADTIESIQIEVNE